MFMELEDVIDIDKDETLEELQAEITYLSKQISILQGSTEELSEAALEGIVNLTKRLIYGTINYIIKITKNLSSSITGIVIANRSALQEIIGKNKIYNSKVAKLPYSSIHKTAIPAFNYKKDAIAMANFFNATFLKLTMVKRLKKIDQLYGSIAGYISIGANEKLSDAIDQLVNLSDTDMSDEVIDQLKATVITQPNRNKITVSDAFTSVNDICKARDLTLHSAEEISYFNTNVKRTKALTKKWDTIVKTLKKVDADEIELDIRVMKRLADCLDISSKQLNMYSTLILEYHHLEVWMGNVLKALFVVVKKNM